MIICSGSEPRSLPGLEVDGERIVTSDQASNSDAETLPERVAVIGGGVIGAEFASVHTDFGVQTTLLEALPHGVLPIGPDRDTADVLAKALAKRGTDIHAEARVGAVEAVGPGSAPVASPIALVPRVALISFPVSAMMTWIVEPQLARLPESWLYAPRRSK